MATTVQDMPLILPLSCASSPAALPSVVHHRSIHDDAPGPLRFRPYSIAQAPMRWCEAMRTEPSPWEQYHSRLKQPMIHAAIEALQITARGGNAASVIAERVRHYEQVNADRNSTIIAEHVQRAASRRRRPVALRTALKRLGSSMTHDVQLKRCALLKPAIFSGIRAGKTWQQALAPFDLPSACLPGQAIVLIEHEIVHAFGLKLFDASGSIHAAAEVLGLHRLGVDRLEEWVVQHRGAVLLAKEPHVHVAERLQLGAPARRKLQEIAVATTGLAQIRGGSNCEEVAAALALDQVGKQHLQKQAAITVGVQRVLSAVGSAPVLDDLKLGSQWNEALLHAHATRAGDTQAPLAKVWTESTTPR